MNWPKPETKLDIGLRKLRDYGGGAVLSDAEANAVLDRLDSLDEWHSNTMPLIAALAVYGEDANLYALAAKARELNEAQP